jgi:hypothetical protein
LSPDSVLAAVVLSGAAVLAFSLDLEAHPLNTNTRLSKRKTIVFFIFSSPP